MPANCRIARESYMRFFDSWIGEVEPLLQTMEAQHAFDPHRWPPWPVGLGIDRLNHGHQFLSQHLPVHFVEEPLTASGLAILFKCCVGKGLLHGGLSNSALRHP